MRGKTGVRIAKTRVHFLTCYLLVLAVTVTVVWIALINCNSLILTICYRDAKLYFSYTVYNPYHFLNSYFYSLVFFWCQDDYIMHICFIQSSRLKNTDLGKTPTIFNCATVWCGNVSSLSEQLIFYVFH